MNIILIAPPAAGKGTQSELIAKKYSLNHISTGDLLREVTSTDSAMSREIKELMNQGKLINDDIILKLIEEKIKNGDGFIFDGFPRNINQANRFSELLNKLGKKIDYVIYLKVDKEVALSRITGRYICPNCNSVYNIKSDDELICKNCGQGLIKRKDDNVETFLERYDVYMNETYPIIDYYKKSGNLIEIDSSKTPEEVFNDIKEVTGMIGD
mgnify:CR=1 FL=1